MLVLHIPAQPKNGRITFGWALSASEQFELRSGEFHKMGAVDEDRAILCEGPEKLSTSQRVVSYIHKNQHPDLTAPYWSGIMRA